MKKLLCVLLTQAALASNMQVQNKYISIEVPTRSWLELRDTNLIRQQYDYSCGAASLASILKFYYGEDVSELDILKWSIQEKGIDLEPKEQEDKNIARLSFLDLTRFAELLGYKAMGLALDFATLSKLKSPVIIYVNVRDIEHFSVYKGSDEQYVYLADPSFGNLKINIAKFIEMFYQRDDLSLPGKVLAILPKQESQINQSFMENLKTTPSLQEIINNTTIRQRLIIRP
ncbi:MAG: C39 family peptidase [Helicobacter sp.]|nr:C39 family peptidase [Helicobacter sp.]